MDSKHNQIGDFTMDETAVLEAGRNGVRLLKKTIFTWIEIGRSVQLIRKKADNLGGRSTFERLMEQEGFPLKKGGVGVFQPATITRLLQIMEQENLSRIIDWHDHLPDHLKIAWASPDSVFKHCPVFTEKTAAAKASTPEAATPKPNAQYQIAELTRQLGLKQREIDQLKTKLDAAGSIITLRGPPRQSADEIVAAKGSVYATDLMHEIKAAIDRKAVTPPNAPRRARR
jgi:hypothetical protein